MILHEAGDFQKSNQVLEWAEVEAERSRGGRWRRLFKRRTGVTPGRYRRRFARIARSSRPFAQSRNRTIAACSERAGHGVAICREADRDGVDIGIDGVDQTH